MKTILQKTAITKILLMLFIAGSTIIGYSQSVKTSIADGDWFNPAIWNPSGVPTMLSPSDTVIINTDVTFGQTLDARGVATDAFRINQGASLTNTYDTCNLALGIVSYLLNYGTISANLIGLGDVSIYTRNYGQINADTIGESDVFNNMAGALISAAYIGTSDNFTNYGQITLGGLGTSGNFTNSSGGIISISGIMATSENVTNNSGGIIIINSLITGDGSLVNNGDISTDAWTNAQNISGTTGKFCVANCFINTGTITGTVDICDATLEKCDMNMGTIAPTVTNCANGPCSTPVNELTNEITVNLYPNPSNGIITIQTDSKQTISINIYNTLGGLVYSTIDKKETYNIDISDSPKGMYFVKTYDGKKFYTENFIIQ